MSDLFRLELMKLLPTYNDITKYGLSLGPFNFILTGCPRCMMRFIFILCLVLMLLYLVDALKLITKIVATYIKTETYRASI